MGLFSKFFKTSTTQKPSSKDKKINEHPVVLSLDDLFVHNFIQKGGKFLYCVSPSEAMLTFQRIIQENNWTTVSCLNNELKEICTISEIKISDSHKDATFFTTCEHLVADTGNIMLSSNQIKEMKLGELNDNFIVIANTSQIVKNMGEGLTGIKSNCKTKIPTNICDIRSYTLEQKKDNFLSYGVSNAKNLYLILVEDL